jgi:hypothetical protein
MQILLMTVLTKELCISGIHARTRCICYGRVRRSRRAGEGVICNVGEQYCVARREGSGRLVLFRVEPEARLHQRQPKKAVDHLVAVTKPTTLKVLIESKLKMNKSDLTM